MQFQQFSVTLTGESPLIMHRDNIQGRDELKAWQKCPEKGEKSVAGDDRSPAWAWMIGVYHNAGRIVIPSDNIMTMLREGGSKLPTGKKQETWKRKTQSGLNVDQIEWPLLVNGRPIDWKALAGLAQEKNFEKHEAAAVAAGFELFVKTAKIGRAKHVRVRPRFNNWSAVGTITVLDEEITGDILAQILDLAGRLCGLMDWRPSSPMAPGPFGKFKTEVKPL